MSDRVSENDLFRSFTFTALIGTEYRAYFCLFLYIWVYELTSLRSAGPRAYVRLIYFLFINGASRNVCCRGGNGRQGCLEQFPVPFVLKCVYVRRVKSHVNPGISNLDRWI